MMNLSIHRLFRAALIIAGVGVAYFATGRFLLVLGAPPNGAVTTVWFPSGISVAALLLFGPLAAIGSFIGSLAFELKGGTPLAGGLMVGIANAGSELLCYCLIVGRGRRALSVATIGDVLRLVIAAVLASVLSAFVGVSAYVIFGVVPGTLYGSTWLTWFGSAVIGILLISPFLVYSVRQWPSLGSRLSYVEYAAALIVLAITAFLWQGSVFEHNVTHHIKDPILLMAILMHLWVAFRFPPAAMTLAVFSFAITSVGGAVLRLHHEAPGEEIVSIFALQVMLGGLAVIGYLLVSMVTARKRSAQALQADIGRREKAEEEVLRLNAVLEQKVAERTGQLLEAQAELDTARARYFSLYDLAPVGYCTISEEALILEANLTAENLLGVARGELVMQPITRFMVREDQDTGNLLFKQLSGAGSAGSGRSGEHQAHEHRMVKKDGTQFWVRMVSSAARDDDGAPIYRIVLSDITERRQAEAERGQSELNTQNAQRLLQLVVDTIPVRLFWKDLDLVFLGCNRLFARDAGYRDPAEMIGTDDYSHGWSEQAESYRRDDLDVIASGKPKLHYEETQDTPDGKRIWLSTSKVPIRDANDQIIGVLGTYEDITLRKLAEEEQLRNQKLAILGQLSGSVGHELRNPLGVMSNAVYFLKMVLAEADETVQEYLDIIKHEIDTSLRIITDLLDFARTKAAQTQAVTARALIDESLGRCAIPENIDLQTQIPDNLPPLRIDPLQMGQVLQNLITNGIQAMPDGGTMRIGARFAGAPAGEPPPQDFIEISIADTGEGISPENMKKLFQPLFTTKAKGIGLGLVVCKNLVEANGGRIAVESESGKGTTFTVALPVEESEH
jgi:PAS domain S-box-containing protein